MDYPDFVLAGQVIPNKGGIIVTNSTYFVNIRKQLLGV